MTVEWLDEDCSNARITRRGASAEVYEASKYSWSPSEWRFRKSGYRVGWLLAFRLDWRRSMVIKARHQAKMQADWEPVAPIPTARLLR